MQYIYFLNIVREKSRFIVSLIENPQKLKEERKKYAGWKGRIEGVGGGVSSSSYSSGSYGSIGGGNYSATSSEYYGENSNSHSKNNKKEEDDSEEEEEEEEEDNNNEKEIKKNNGKKVGKNIKEEEGEESFDDEDEENKDKIINKNNNKNIKIINEGKVNKTNNLLDFGNTGESNSLKPNSNEKGDDEKEQVLKNIFIDEVVTEDKIKFFREPRLGCYFAIDIRYNSSLNYDALKTAIENLEEYNVKKADYDKRMAEKAEEEKERELEKKENEEEEEEKKEKLKEETNEENIEQNEKNKNKK